ncbi:MAG: hypothetical protein R3F11_08405 [Verrucomicrobiales bacterium]
MARVSEYPAAMDFYRVPHREAAPERRPSRMDTAQAALDLLLTEMAGEASAVAEELV